MNKNKTYLILLLFLISTFIYSQPFPEQNTGILFYNVENLFDTYNDSLKNDEEFLPHGSKYWNYNKYQGKIKNISRLIYESGNWNPPMLIGMCEIENDKVLNDLIYKTGLSNLKYDYIHYESPDKRGVDVALLYRKNIFTILESRPIPVKFNSESRPTRDILYVFGLIEGKLPLHIFVTHFPSRYGGIMESNPKRIIASNTLCDTIIKIQQHDRKANILVMGDFNDTPQDSSMQLISKKAKLVNLSPKPTSINGSLGTLKHHYEWNIFDQILVSESILDSINTVNSDKYMKILDFDFLLEDDKNYTGKKPFRTYIGYRYNNGYSDHLPVWINLYFRKTFQ